MKYIERLRKVLWFKFLYWLGERCEFCGGFLTPWLCKRDMFHSEITHGIVQTPGIIPDTETNMKYDVCYRCYEWFYSGKKKEIRNRFLCYKET